MEYCNKKFLEITYIAGLLCNIYWRWKQIKLVTSIAK